MLEQNRVKIDEKSFQSLIKILKKKTGLNLEYYRRTFILRRIKARMLNTNFNILEKYNDYLLSQKEELRKFVDSFNINYTYFFRDWEVYATIQKLFLQSLNMNGGDFLHNLRPKASPEDEDRPKRQLMVQKEILFNQNMFSRIWNLSLYKKIKNPRTPKTPIYIWSCACASGEEPYSLSIILHNLKEYTRKTIKYQIIASDIDKYAIEDAKKAVYTEESVRDVSPYYLNKYFYKKNTPSGKKYHLSHKIKKEITFLNEDITKIHMYSWKFDIIFCRNLLIYFNIENRNKFIKTLEHQLNDGGLLVLGKTESLFDKQGTLKLIDPRNHIYMK